MRHLILYILCICSLVSAIEVNDLNIAVIWNDRTDSRLASRGWKVGNDPTNSGLDTTIEACPAPEIGKAQLKILLSSFERSMPFDSTLDTMAIPNTLFDDNGLPDGPHQGKFKKVRIYSKSSTPLSLDKIKQDFMDVKPDAIIYINAGAEWVKPGDDDGGLYQLLRDAADNDIGIMTIGDASLIDARNIDPDKTRFPVMGVQKTYRFKAYSCDATHDNDTIREFNFLKTNDTPEWEISDTVVLYSTYDPSKNNADAAVYTIKTTDGTKIYEGKGVNTDGSKMTFMHPDIILNKEDIMHAYGEWSINAKAVEVVDEDLYAPEMAAGIYPNHDVILAGRGYGNNTRPVIASRTWGEDMWVNGVKHATLGSNIPDYASFGTATNGVFTFDKDYVVGKPNIDDNSKIDSILIIKSGLALKGIDQSNEKDEHYLGTYYAGGYKDLKIRLFDDNNTKNIFEDVFPKLKDAGIKELKFKPWTKGGRIKAAADIWAVNEKLTLKDFDDINTDGFDPDAYYRAYLGDQVAGADGYPHFVQPPKAKQNFTKLRQDSLGYDQDGKLYHVISAIQNGHRRMVMLGFQPSYLDDLDAVLDLLEDATKWIAIDDYQLPTPQIIPMEGGVELVPADGQEIYTDHKDIKFRIDFTKKGIVLHEAAFKVSYTIEYGSQTKTGFIEFEADDGADHIEEGTIDLSSIIAVDPTITADTKVKITAVAEPMTDKAPFDKSHDTTATLDIRKLEAHFENGNNDESISFKGTYDEKIISEKSISGEDVSDVKISFAKDGGSWEEEEAPYSYGVNIPTLSIVATAVKARYINADTLRRSYEKEDLNLPTPTVDIKAADVNGTGKYFFFNDAKLLMELEAYDIAGTPITDDDYDLSFTQSGDSKSMPDTGEIIIELDYIDSLIAERHTAFVIEDAIAEAEDQSKLKNSSPMEKQSYEFRTVDLEISKISGNDDDPNIKIIFKATDPVTNEELTSAKIYYTLDGSDADDGSTGPVSSSDEVEITNGVRVKAIAIRSGYISGNENVSFQKEVYIDADPASGTFFGEKLDIELRSNHQPILYAIDGGSTVAINGTSGTFTLQDGVGNLIRDNDTVVIKAWIEGDEFVQKVEETFVYYRRKLPTPEVNPASGDYPGSVEVSMSIAVDASHDADIYYYSEKIADTTKLSDMTKYSGKFNVEPDTTIYVRAYADNWLPSDTVERNYKRILVSKRGDFYDRDADGIIDSLVVEMDTIIDGFDKPDSIKVTLPEGGETVLLTSKSNFAFDGNTITAVFDDFSTVLTGFSTGEYVTLYGDRYSSDPVNISDKVAPVIASARYNSGSYDDGSAERDADTLIVTFTEDIADIGSVDKEELFNFKSASNSYSADVSLFKKISDKEYIFTVEDLHGVTYPTKGDSIWINVESGVPLIEDTRENEQLEEENRKVEMVVGKLEINVIMKAYWINRTSDGFDQVTSPEDIATPVGGFTSFGIDNGALITIDPLIPYLESEVDGFDVQLRILDAVGNVVAEVDGIGSGEHIKALPAEMVVNKEGDRRIVIAIAWDGNNSTNRKVHKRTFKVEAVTKWPNIDDEIKPKSVLLPVIRNKEEE